MCEVAERYRRDLACLSTFSPWPPQTDKQTDTKRPVLAPMPSVLPDTQSSVEQRGGNSSEAGNAAERAEGSGTHVCTHSCMYTFIHAWFVCSSHESLLSTSQRMTGSILSTKYHVGNTVRPFSTLVTHFIEELKSGPAISHPCGLSFSIFGALHCYQ